MLDFSEMSEDMRARYAVLSDREATGNLTDNERRELRQLRCDLDIL